MQDALYQALKNITAKPDDTPAIFLWRHFEAYHKNTALQKKRTRSGRLFEALVYDCLVRCGVNRECIGLHQSFTDVRGSEVDIAIRGTVRGSEVLYGIHCKTSTRERAAQPNMASYIVRDKMVGTHVELYLFHATEFITGPKAFDKLYNLKYCQKQAETANYIDDFVSMYDAEKVGKLMKRFKQVKS